MCVRVCVNEEGGGKKETNLSNNIITGLFLYDSVKMYD